MLSQAEFEAILADSSKRIAGDIVWEDDLPHPPARRFRVLVDSDRSWPLAVIGWWQPSRGKLSYGLVHTGARGRIVGLDLGYPPHRNPTAEILGGTHKHRWTDAYGPHWAYEPVDITADWDQPLEVWRQFCAETGIVHAGALPHPMRQREELL